MCYSVYFDMLFIIAPKDQGHKKCHEAVLKSLANLDFTYIDLYLIHWPGVQKTKHNDPRNLQLRQESWTELEALVHEGSLRSNVTFERMLNVFCL